MGRIADAAVLLLANGPVAIADLGAALAGTGITRAQDPIAAVRRALRDDPRIVEVSDGRLARLDLVLGDVVLTTRVSPQQVADGALDVEGDLAPLALAGITGVPLPAGVRAGEIVTVQVEEPVAGAVSVHRAITPVAHPHDEAALCEAVRTMRRPNGPSSPVLPLPAVFALVASQGHVFRTPGRPLTQVLAEHGWEVHLGWVGPAGTPWHDLTAAEADALEADVATLMAAERHAEAAAVQDRLVGVLRRHLPERVPSARRRLARVLTRSGRTHEARTVLTGAFGFDDPEDRYEAALLALREGDIPAARRLVEEGLARAAGPERATVAHCLTDIADDLDAHAAFRRAMDRLRDADPADVAQVAAAAVVAAPRSCLVEAAVDRLFGELDDESTFDLLELISEVPDAGPDACLAYAAVHTGPAADHARELAGAVRAQRPWVRGLQDAHPVSAWTTSPEHAPDQQQLVICVAKEQGRVAPLVVLIDHDDLGGAVKEAFFLPDMAEPRVRRELLEPMGDIGLPCTPIPVSEARTLLGLALLRTAELEWHLPSEDHQPVRRRMDRWVLHHPD